MRPIEIRNDGPTLDVPNEGVAGESVAGVLTAVLLFLAVTVGFRTLGFHPPRITPILILGGTLATLLFVGARALHRIPIAASLVLLWFWMALSVTWSDNTVGSAHTIVRDVSLMVALMLLASVCRRETLFATLLWSIRFAIVLTLLALAFRPGNRVSPDLTGLVVAGWRGLFPHKNYLGPFLAIATVTVLSFDRRRPEKYLTLLGIVVLLIGSRSVIGITGTMLAVAVLGWLQIDARIDGPARTRFRLVTSILTPIAVLTMAASAVSLAGLWGKDQTFSGRTEIWQASINAWSEHRLLGYGLEGVLQPRPLTPATSAMWREIGFETTHAHNGLLSVGLQLGVIGLVILLIVYVSTMVDAIRLLPYDRVLASWVISLLIAQLYISVGEDVFLGNAWVGMLVVFKVVLLRRTRSLRDAASGVEVDGLGQ